MKEKIQYWRDMADYDIETAKTMLNGKRYLYVGFMCHQVIEKILKGYYVLTKRENPPFTHNLTFLAIESGIYEEATDAQKDFIDMLEPLNIQARYPTHKEKLMKTLNKTKCKEILRNTEELYKWIRQRLLIG